MKRFVLLVVLAFALFSFSFSGSATQEAFGQDVLYTLKYQFLAPRSINVEKVIKVPDPLNKGQEKLKTVKKTYWYQVFYLKNPTKENIDLSFSSMLLVDTVKTVKDPETGDVIDVSSVLPAFKGKQPNFVVNPKTGNRIPVPGTAFNPIHNKEILNKVIEELRIKSPQTDKFKNSFQNELITDKLMDTYCAVLDLNKPMKGEETKQIIALYTDLDRGFDSLVFRFAGLTNEYVFESEEDKEAGKGYKKVLRLEYERPGDEFDTSDTNPEPVDLFHLQSNEWLKVPIS